MKRPSRQLMLIALLFIAGCTTTPSEEKVPTEVVPTKPSAPPPPPKFDGIINARTIAPCQPKAQRQGGVIGLPMTPSDFSTMSSCRPQVPMLTNVAGSVDKKGDCRFANGVVCHYHGQGNEFGAPGLAQGEVHCIFPTSKPERPTVLGFLYKCQAAALLQDSSRPANAAGACGAQLLPLLGGCGVQQRCCSNGNLTDEWSKQSPAERSIRPNFVMCAMPKTIDCGANGPLAGMLARGTNNGLEIR